MHIDIERIYKNKYEIALVKIIEYNDYCKTITWQMRCKFAQCHQSELYHITYLYKALRGDDKLREVIQSIVDILEPSKRLELFNFIRLDKDFIFGIVESFVNKKANEQVKEDTTVPETTIQILLTQMFNDIMDATRNSNNNQIEITPINEKIR